jgi:Raf kinase inhibitor-like YbhB/YbcL family protein
VSSGGKGRGRNDFNQIGYAGPCPPPGKPHRYYFRLYALDAKLDLEAGCTRDDVAGAMEGHILSKGHVMGVYKRRE